MHGKAGRLVDHQHQPVAVEQRAHHLFRGHVAFLTETAITGASTAACRAPLSRRSMKRARNKAGWRRLTGGLKRTSSALGGAITDLVTKRKLDAATIEDRGVLIRADLGVDAAARIAAAVGEGRYDKAIAGGSEGGARRRGREGARRPSRSRWRSIRRAKPFVILVVGVNGSGKTTTIGKLAAKFRAEGRKRDAGGRRHLPRRRDRAAQDLGRAHRRRRHRARSRAPMPPVSRSMPCARPRSDGADVLLDRHRRPPAEPHRTDGRTGEDRARDEEGRCRRRRTRCCWCSMRPSGRTRCRRSRVFAQGRRRHRPRDDQARRHRARRHPGRHRRKVQRCRCISSASAKASTIWRRSPRRISPAPSRALISELVPASFLASPRRWPQ